MGTPILVGTDGLCAGEHYVLSLDAPVTIGRSSGCEISLQKLPRFMALDEDARAGLTDFFAISRHHLRLRVSAGIAHLENLSAAGTWCDGARFDKGKQVDLAKGPVLLRIGPAESFQLMLLERGELERIMAKTRPMQLATTRLSPPSVTKPTGTPTSVTPPPRT